MADNVPQPYTSEKRNNILRKIKQLKQIKKNSQIAQKYKKSILDNLANTNYTNKNKNINDNINTDIENGKLQVKTILKSCKKNNNDNNNDDNSNSNINNNNNININNNTNKDINYYISKNKFTMPINNLIDENNYINDDLSSSLNSKKSQLKKILLINFDDDTMLPIIEESSEKIKVIEKWYDNIGVQIDIEPTELLVPSDIRDEELQEVLYQELNYCMKDELIKQYLPLFFEQIASSKKIKNYEQHIGIKRKIINFEGDFNSNKSYPINTIRHNSPNSLNIMNENSIHLGSFNTFKKSWDWGSLPVTPFADEDNETFDYQHLEQKNEKKLQSGNFFLKMSYYNKLYNINVPENIMPNDDQQFLNCKITVKNYILKTNFTNYENEILAYNERNINTSYFLNDQNNKNDMYICSIIYNLKFNKSFVITNPSVDELHYIDAIDTNKYQFINLLNIKSNNKEILKFIQDQFHVANFNSIEDLNKKLKVLSENLEYILDHMNTNNIYFNEEMRVKEFMKFHYRIDNDINNRMKSSVLHDAIIEAKIVKEQNIPSFKVRLAKYFQDMGLKKKRYSDGIYYYGIKIFEPTLDEIRNSSSSFFNMPLENIRNESVYEFRPPTSTSTMFEFKPPTPTDVKFEFKPPTTTSTMFRFEPPTTNDIMVGYEPLPFKGDFN